MAAAENELFSSRSAAGVCIESVFESAVLSLTQSWISNHKDKALPPPQKKKAKPREPKIVVNIKMSHKSQSVASCILHLFLKNPQWTVTRERLDDVNTRGTKLLIENSQKKNP